MVENILKLVGSGVTGGSSSVNFDQSRPNSPPNPTYLMASSSSLPPSLPHFQYFNANLNCIRVTTCQIEIHSVYRPETDTSRGVTNVPFIRDGTWDEQRLRASADLSIVLSRFRVRVTPSLKWNVSSDKKKDYNFVKRFEHLIRFPSINSFSFFFCFFNI